MSEEHGRSWGEARWGIARWSGLSFADRMRRVLPRRWFPDDAPVLGALLAGFDALWTDLWAQLAYVRAQTRLLTATGAWLDGKASDFLGVAWFRRSGEADAAFAARTAREILRPRVTRPALVQIITEETGAPPRIFEPTNAADTGGYGAGGVGYGVAGGYGSLLIPCEVFVQVARQAGAVPTASHDGIPADVDLFAAVNSVTAAGVIAWTRISDGPVQPGTPAPSGGS